MDGHTYALIELQVSGWVLHRDQMLAAGRYLEHDAACRTVNRLRRQARGVLESRVKKVKAKSARVDCPVAQSFPVFLTRDEALGRAVRYGGSIIQHGQHWHVASDPDRIYARRG